MRVRISTTVDESRLTESRLRLGCRDSELFDSALAALLERLDAEAEINALSQAPYDDDPHLAMPKAADTDDEYSPAPAHVQRRAEARRLARGAAVD